MQLSLTSLLVCAAATTCWLYWLCTRYRFYKFALNFPGVWGLPVLGVVLNIGSINNVLPYLSSLFNKNKARTLCIWLSLTPVVVTEDPKVVEQVLTSPQFLKKANVFYTPLKDASNGGLIALPVEKWKKMRKIVVPSFGHKQLLSFMPTFNAKSKEFLKLLEELSESKQAHDILDAVRFYVLIMSKETIMGHSKKENLESIKYLLKRLIFILHYIYFEMILNTACLRFLLKYNPYMHWVKKQLYNFTNEIISYRLKRGLPATEVPPKESSTNDIEIKHKPLIFIEQAYAAYSKGELSWQDIIGESNAILVAFFETTSSVIFSALVLLATHPEIQERLYSEIMTIFPEKDFDVNYKDLENLTYLEMVINETMRLLPPAPLIARQAIEDTTLLVDNISYKIPRDMTIAISVYHLQREPTIWGAEANKFNPDNFEMQNSVDRHSYAFIPFSKGSRNCVGWTYAYATMKVILTHVLKNYRVSSDFKYEDIKVNLSLFLEFKVKPKLKFHPR